jgi:hypothetical protein
MAAASDRRDRAACGASSVAWSLEKEDKVGNWRCIAVAQTRARIFFERIQVETAIDVQFVATPRPTSDR